MQLDSAASEADHSAEPVVYGEGSGGWAHEAEVKRVDERPLDAHPEEGRYLGLAGATAA